MSTYKKRSDYFKLIATKNKLIAHEKPLAKGVRKSFHRVNDEEELNASCANWAHFPCVVHIGNDIRHAINTTGLPQIVTGNHLYFLSKLDKATYKGEADAIEAAYAEAENAMNQFLSYLRQDMELNDCCGNIFLFDLNRSRADMIGPINNVLYGWYLMFEDKNKTKELNYKGDDWFDGVSIPDDCGCEEQTPPEDTEDPWIFFNDETIVEIEMTEVRRKKFGRYPLMEVWYYNNDGGAQEVIVPRTVDAPPPYTTKFFINNSEPRSGYVILSKPYAFVASGA